MVIDEGQAFQMCTQRDSLAAALISQLARAGSASVRTISILGLVFLPGTFVNVSLCGRYWYRCGGFADVLKGHLQHELL